MSKIKVTCIKEYAGDVDQYGIDFIVGNTYGIVNQDENYTYVESESGSDVMLTNEEMQETFKGLSCTSCGQECFDEFYPQVVFQDATHCICEECSIDYEELDNGIIRLREEN